MPLIGTNQDGLAFDALLLRRGEPVVFRKANARAVINHLSSARKLAGRVDASSLDAATVQFPLAVKEPEKNEILTDKNGNTFRIVEVRRLSGCWHCETEAHR